uniref:Neugrin n=1 Tax=Myoviridae sp. ctjhW4 TaxID=2825162 RepID=A0A8S5PRI0_9CAUD|nr:MAG TPA: Neugrin [Myoviridae sp. ctjhW4]
MSAGDTVTSALDKIKQVLGNYEYFYDLDGNFIFQE